MRLLTVEIDELTAEITERVTAVAPSLLAIVGCGPLTAAKIIGETAHVRRFRSKDAFARHNGTAPLPVWSSNKQRHRLSRTGNRQLNAALHRIAMTQARMHPPAQELLARRKTAATAEWKHYGSSNADSQTSSTEPCSPTKAGQLSPLLDRGETDTRRHDTLDPQQHSSGQRSGGPDDGRGRRFTLPLDKMTYIQLIRPAAAANLGPVTNLAAGS